MPSNRWNRMVYRAWAPLYDRVLERFFAPGRTTAARMLGVDLSEPMLRRARKRQAQCAAEVDLLASAPCQVVSDTPSLLGGQYRVILLRRYADVTGPTGAAAPHRWS